jgi:hypothetical protein
MSAHLLEDSMAESIRECLLQLLLERGPGRLLSVSEVAQTLSLRVGYHWHDLMRPVRMIVASLADTGVIEALQFDRVIDIRSARGPVHIRLRPIAGQRSPEQA